jgi:hypothetical protein
MRMPQTKPATLMQSFALLMVDNSAVGSSQHTCSALLTGQAHTPLDALHVPLMPCSTKSTS